MSEGYFFSFTDKSFADELSSFMAEIEGSDDSEILKSASDRTVFQYAYVKENTKHIVGFIQYRPDGFYTDGSIGYIVRPSERNKGICKMMLSDFISFIGMTGVTFLSAVISNENIYSLKAASSCGGICYDRASEKDALVYYFKCADCGYICDISGIKLFLASSEKLFSPSAPDKGTLAMLSVCSFKENDKILDLGCGCGIAGIYAYLFLRGKCTVYQTDISEEAVEITKKNSIFNRTETISAVSDGFDSFSKGGLDLILSNPPYHTDFSVAKNFIEKGFKRLKTGGRMYMVTKRLDWYKNKLTSVFGGVKVTEKDGYYIFYAEKRTALPPEKKKKEKGGMSSKLKRKYGLL